MEKIESDSPVERSGTKKERESTMKEQFNLDSLNLKTNVIDASKLSQLKLTDTAQVKTKTALRISESLFKNPNAGQSIGGPPNWDKKAQVKRAILRDLRILGKVRNLKPRCVEHGNELIFCYEAIKPKKTKESPAANAA
jgi:hypothetical protein